MHAAAFSTALQLLIQNYVIFTDELNRNNTVLNRKFEIARSCSMFECIVYFYVVDCLASINIKKGKDRHIKRIQSANWIQLTQLMTFMCIGCCWNS